LTAADALRFGVVGRQRAERQHGRETERRGAARHLTGDTAELIDGLRMHINLS